MEYQHGALVDRACSASRLSFRTSETSFGELSLFFDFGFIEFMAHGFLDFTHGGDRDRRAPHIDAHRGTRLLPGLAQVWSAVGDAGIFGLKSEVEISRFKHKVCSP